MRLLVIGGGAAGFFCAITAARLNRNLQVTIVEKTAKLLSKVRVSGGGRCNVTHACFSIEEIIEKYPRGKHFVKKTFHQFFTKDTIEWFRQRGVMLKTEADGRMFPVTDSSETIVNALMQEAKKYHVDIRTNAEVKKISSADKSWKVEFADGLFEIADAVCVACGGYPKEPMFEWLKQTEHSIEVPVPSLFTFNMPGNALTQLMGVSAPAKIKIAGTRLEEQGAVLITHWGLSGPAVLRLSAAGARALADVKYRFTVLINWTATRNEQQVREQFVQQRVSHPSRKLWTGNDFGVPQRLWEHLCNTSGVTGLVRWSDLPATLLNRLVRNLTAHELPVEGKTTFKEEFVTAGGITLSEVNPQTMESRLMSGLFFAGEILDVDGVTGGFNFQHAWTSGWIAGKSIAERMEND